MARAILQPRDGTMLAAVSAGVVQKSTDSGNYGKPLEVSEYSSISAQVWWDSLDGAGTFKIQTTLKSNPTEADWIDKIGASLTVNTASGTDEIIVTHPAKSVRAVWIPDTASLGYVSVDVMGKAASGPLLLQKVALLDALGIPFSLANRLAVTSSFSGLNNGGRILNVEVNNTDWTALPALAFSGRNAISIINRSGQDIVINYDPLVLGFFGVPIDSGSERFYDISDGIVIYAKSQNSVCNVIVEELA